VQRDLERGQLLIVEVDFGRKYCGMGVYAPAGELVALRVGRTRARRARSDR
jgi:hypothetical protein